MKQTLSWLAAFWLMAALTVAGCGQGEEPSHTTHPMKTAFVTIGTGGITGVYYPTGGAIAKIVNLKKDRYGIRFTVESTPGSVFNVNAVLGGDFQFGIVQSDCQYQAVKGLAAWKTKGPQTDLRSVFSLHPESVTLIASVKSGIKTLADLRGKRVNIGDPGSGNRLNALEVIEAAGLDSLKDIQAREYKALDAPSKLQQGLIDAFFYTVGHPSGAIKEATLGPVKVRFIPITGMDALLRHSSYYARSIIPIKLYPHAQNDTDVETFGVKATLVTSAKVPDKIVYAVTKEIFVNFDKFKQLHPVYQVLTKKGMLTALTAPIHPGALRYYRETGLL